MHLTKTICFVLLLILTNIVSAQSLYFTKSGQINFFSETPIEDIKAVNKKVYSIINTETGAIQFTLKMKDFEFKYDAMQQHFNDEDYMDSEKYPTSAFKGIMVNREAILFTKNGSYTAIVDGELTMHGVTRPVKTNATIQVENGKISGKASFLIKLEEFNIKVPKIVIKKIAELVEVTVHCRYEVYKN
jgi:polyisoprenoid-binding protein YceI